MTTRSFVDQTQPFVLEGVKLGLIAALLSSIGYTVSLSIFLFMVGGKSENATGTFITIVIWGGSIMCLLGILPAAIIGLIGGGMIGLIIGIQRKRPSNFVASTIGLIIGVVLILVANYLFWANSPLSTPTNYVPFFQYMFALKIDIYTIPNIIAPIISAYLGWKINKVGILAFENKAGVLSVSEEK